MSVTLKSLWSRPESGYLRLCRRNPSKQEVYGRTPFGHVITRLRPNGGSNKALKNKIKNDLAEKFSPHVLQHLSKEKRAVLTNKRSLSSDTLDSIYCELNIQTDLAFEIIGHSKILLRQPQDIQPPVRSGLFEKRPGSEPDKYVDDHFKKLVARAENQRKILQENKNNYRRDLIERMGLSEHLDGPRGSLLEGLVDKIFEANSDEILASVRKDVSASIFYDKEAYSKRDDALGDPITHHAATAPGPGQFPLMADFEESVGERRDELIARKMAPVVKQGLQVLDLLSATDDSPYDPDETSSRIAGLSASDDGRRRLGRAAALACLGCDVRTVALTLQGRDERPPLKPEIAFIVSGLSNPEGTPPITQLHINQFRTRVCDGKPLDAFSKSLGTICENYPDYKEALSEFANMRGITLDIRLADDVGTINDLLKTIKTSCEDNNLSEFKAAAARLAVATATMESTMRLVRDNLTGLSGVPISLQSAIKDIHSRFSDVLKNMDNKDGNFWHQMTAFASFASGASSEEANETMERVRSVAGVGSSGSRPAGRATQRRRNERPAELRRTEGLPADSGREPVSRRPVSGRPISERTVRRVSTSSDPYTKLHFEVIEEILKENDRSQFQSIFDQAFSRLPAPPTLSGGPAPHEMIEVSKTLFHALAERAFVKHRNDIRETLKEDITALVDHGRKGGIGLPQSEKVVRTNVGASEIVGNAPFVRRDNYSDRSFFEKGTLSVAPRSRVQEDIRNKVRDAVRMRSQAVIAREILILVGGAHATGFAYLDALQRNGRLPPEMESNSLFDQRKITIENISKVLIEHDNGLQRIYNLTEKEMNGIKKFEI